MISVKISSVIVFFYLISDDVDFLAILCCKSFADFFGCIKTNGLARGACINDCLLAEVLEIVEGSPSLKFEFDIIECQLGRQSEKICLPLLKLSELIAELLDLCLERFNSSILLLPASLELCFY